MSGHKTALRVIQISDTHLQSQPGGQLWGVDVDTSLTAVLNHLKVRHWPADFLIATGDLVQDEGASAYRRLQTFLDPLGVPVYCLPGNHDSVAILSEVLATGRVRRERHVIAKPWQFILLDSSIPHSEAGHLPESELVFLERTLLTHPELYTVVCIHHPPLPVSSYWLDATQIDNGEELLILVERFPRVRAVVWGHIHQAFSARRGNMDLLGTPSTCMQFKPGALTAEADTLAPGYRWFELHADGTLHTGIERTPHR